jgi:CubicO group peptidase (beta-lactamase class C family)
MHLIYMIFFLTFWLFQSVLSQCYDPSPAFPIPSWGEGGRSLTSTLKNIEEKIAAVVAEERHNACSFSIELTSRTQTLWSHFYTARQRNESRPGTDHVDGHSIYRISAVTKVFTVLGVMYQHAAGNLSLDDAISKYIPKLNDGALSWSHITLRTLASQLSGIPREFAHSDMINQFDDPTSVGLPPPAATRKMNVPACDEYKDYLPCKRSDLLRTLKGLKPVFAPNEKSTYSNVAYELLGLAIENATGKHFEPYLDSAIFKPLKMSSTTISTPKSEKHAVLPIWSKGDNYWGIDEGVQSPTAGIYSSSSDMSKFLRHVLTKGSRVVKGLNWFLPASWSTGFRTFYGMPWEILRTEKVLSESKRPVTFVSKSGGIPGYYSKITLMPEYGLGLTILVGGEKSLLDEILEIVTVNLIREAEEVLWGELADMFDGTYVTTKPCLNSSITLASSSSRGIEVTSFISNSTEVLDVIFGREVPGNAEHWRAQLVPTMLFKDPEKRRGEIWRLITVPERDDEAFEGKVWADLCNTDVDTSRYAGIPANEFVFWYEEGILELPAWRVEMRNQKERQKGSSLLVQDL